MPQVDGVSPESSDFTERELGIMEMVANKTNNKNLAQLKELRDLVDQTNKTNLEQIKELNDKIDKSNNLLELIRDSLHARIDTIDHEIEKIPRIAKHLCSMYLKDSENEDRSRSDNIIFHDIPSKDIINPDDCFSIIDQYISNLTNLPKMDFDKAHFLFPPKKDGKDKIIIRLKDYRSKIQLLKRRQDFQSFGIRLSNDLSKQTRNSRRVLWRYLKDEGIQEYKFINGTVKVKNEKLVALGETIYACHNFQSDLSFDDILGHLNCNTLQSSTRTSNQTSSGSSTGSSNGSSTGSSARSSTPRKTFDKRISPITKKNSNK